MEKKIKFVNNMISALVFGLLAFTFIAKSAYLLAVIAGVSVAAGYFLMRRGPEADEREMQVRTLAMQAAYGVSILYLFGVFSVEYIRTSVWNPLFYQMALVLLVTQYGFLFLFRKVWK
jgi:hypothetical protein